MPLTILGLGPGSYELLTLAAHRKLSEATEVYLRTSRHPTVESLPPHLDVHSFDDLYESLPSFADVYDAIVQQVWELAKRPQGVLYAVPGDPMMAEATVAALLERGKAASMPIEIISGVSFLEPGLAAIGRDPFTAITNSPATPPGLQLVDALQPRCDPGCDALVAQIYSRDVASRLKVELLELYPAEHMVQIIRNAGRVAETQVIDVPLYQLDHEDYFDHLTCLYIPALAPLQNLSTTQGLADIVAKLRAPDGCPWDRAQSHVTLKPYIIEEAYEALDALDREDMDDLQEELGDLLLNIFLHCQIASEEDDFDLADVVRGISQKLIRRHPHVFGDLKLSTPQEVMQNWEALKDKEREKEESMLDGLPKALPALAYARSLESRLAPLHLPEDTATSDSTRFINTLKQHEQLTIESVGSALFDLAYSAAAAGVDPEEALREANSRFVQRIRTVETLAREQGVSLPASSEALRNKLWVQTQNKR